MAPGSERDIAEPGTGGGCLREIAYAAGYDSGTAALQRFYIPVLQRATTYDRSVGYFRSSSLSVAARGMSRFVAHGGRVRLLVGAELDENDAKAMRGALEITPELAERLSAALVTEDDIDRRRLEVLAWLAKEGRLEVRVAIPIDEDGHPLPTVGETAPYFHEKIGVLRDSDGHGVAFQGSVNESAKAWSVNFESFSVFTSWGAPDHFDHWAEAFERRWSGDTPGFRVYTLPDAVRESLVTYAPAEPPPDRDPEEREAVADRALLARFLEVAPRLPNAQGLAEATIGIEPFPHQRQIAERLAGQYPRSWLVADEVGLGKTISAGLALRRLLLSGQVKRALILAPANVARQWQDELFEKFGLWVPRLERGRILGAHHEDVRSLGEGENPYATEPVLIASSHLARRHTHRQLILEAAPYDLIIVDEAHHARRRSFYDLSKYRPSLLLELLDELRDKAAYDAIWLLTATPMQVHPIELRDLLRIVGLGGALESWANFERFYAQLASPDDTTDWRFLADALRQTPLPPAGAVEAAFLADIEASLGPVARDRIERFAESSDPEETVRNLDSSGRSALRAWIRLRSPIGSLVTRHSRQTLKQYRDAGLLTQPVAERNVEDITIEFSPKERRLYSALDRMLDRLMQLHASRRNAGFVLTIYRRRLTSSWEAIRKTLNRRVLRQTGLVIEADLLTEVEAEEAEELGLVDDQEAVPLTQEDLAEIAGYLDDMAKVEDSKLDQLRHDIDEARASGQSAIVFTQFADTMEYLRDILVGSFRDQLATFSGEGGFMYDRELRSWYRVAKQDLVDAIRTGRCSVLLATDAASEGLNLQACSYLINYDLPWNPMRLEQRIGRIDRVGQQSPVITVKNYIIPGTVEVEVYMALKQRIGDFNRLVGKLQPILGATEGAVKRVYGAGLDQRASATAAEIKALNEQLDELEASGIDFVEEDPMPVPQWASVPVNLRELERRIVEDLNIGLGDANRPVTFDAHRVSRDPTDWRALGTYGHPRLAEALANIGDSYDADSGCVVFAEVGEVVAAVRADRSPPEPVRVVQELDELGTAQSRGEATEMAESIAREEHARRESARREVLRLRDTDWQQSIRLRFLRLMKETISARVALREMQTAEEHDPVEEWKALRDEIDVLRYAEAFRSRLGLSVDELIPSRAEIDSVKNKGAKALAETARSAGPALRELMQTWSQRRPDPGAGAE
jgi:ERCC4-related helicase